MPSPGELGARRRIDGGHVLSRREEAGAAVEPDLGSLRGRIGAADPRVQGDDIEVRVAVEVGHDDGMPVEDPHLDRREAAALDGDGPHRLSGRRRRSAVDETPAADVPEEPHLERGGRGRAAQVLDEEVDGAVAVEVAREPRAAPRRARGRGRRGDRARREPSVAVVDGGAGNARAVEVHARNARAEIGVAVAVDVHGRPDADGLDRKLRRRKGARHAVRHAASGDHVLIAVTVEVRDSEVRGRA